MVHVLNCAIASRSVRTLEAMTKWTGRDFLCTTVNGLYQANVFKVTKTVNFSGCNYHVH